MTVTGDGAAAGSESEHARAEAADADGPRHIGMVLHSLGGGGAERVAATLATQLMARGHRVDMVLGKSEIDFPNNLPAGLRLFHPALPSVGSAVRRLCRERGVEVRPLVVNAMRAPGDVWRLLPRAAGVRIRLPHMHFAHLVAEYLRRERPSLLLSSLAPANFAAVNAARLAAPGPPVVISIHSNLRLDYSEYERAVAATLYPRASAVVVVSCGLRTELQRTLGVPPQRVQVIYNPIPAARIGRLARQAVAHSWFQSGQPRVILSVGREAPAKDHQTTVRAFGHVRREMAARLVILGHHSKSYRVRLSSLARQCGVEEDLGFLDFHENPYRYMARASAVVLSSFWEGLPTVLLEALACGTPVVSTDTPYGPREILGGGKFGRLAPVGDALALAAAMLQTLRGDNPPADALRLRAADFSGDRAVRSYLGIFGQVAGA